MSVSLRKSLLLHVCCAPCACGAVENLTREFRLTFFFSNSNIAPEDEYRARLRAAEKLAAQTGVPLVVDSYDHAAWLNHVRGLETEPEGGLRCEQCFAFNLVRAADYARNNGFDVFTTALTISPHKDSRTIFRIGSAYSNFLQVDFKKRDGFRRGVDMSRQHDLYRQSYCGCEFSMRAGLKRRTAPFREYKAFMKETYGKALYRVPIDLGFGCPHRDSDGSGGCTFCAADGSRSKYIPDAAAVRDQAAAGIEFAKARYGAGGFMAYIQAYTGTFAPVAEQRKIYEDLLGSFAFDALSIGTRPDCLPDDVLDFLSELGKRVDLWIELGIQTVHDETLKRINRGHDWSTSREAIHKLKDRGIKVAAHVILGLPGEDESHFRRTAETLAAMPLDAMKIHNLHVVRGTALEREFGAGSFRVYDEHEYAEILIDFLRRLPSSLPIIRINTDTPDAELIAPRWNIGKGRFRDLVYAEMRRRDLRQGDLFEPACGCPKR